MESTTEAVSLIYDKGDLIALVKRDNKSKKTLVYMVKEAKTNEIIRLVTKQEHD